MSENKKPTTKPKANKQMAAALLQAKVVAPSQTHHKNVNKEGDPVRVDKPGGKWPVAIALIAVVLNNIRSVVSIRHHEDQTSLVIETKRAIMGDAVMPAYFYRVSPDNLAANLVVARQDPKTGATERVSIPISDVEAENLARAIEVKNNLDKAAKNQLLRQAQNMTM